MFFKLRYLSLFLILLISFKLLSVSQGNKVVWEYSPDILLAIKRFRLVLIILMLLEVVLFVLSRSHFSDMGIMGKSVYVFSIFMALIICILCNNGELLSLPVTSPMLSRFLETSVYWGSAISVVIVGYLTFFAKIRSR